MINPDDIDSEAADIELNALEQAATASALAGSNDPAEREAAARMQSQTFALTMQARQRHKDAQKLREKLNEITKQIDAKQAEIDAKVQEKASLGDANDLVGAAARSSARAKELEKQIYNLQQHDDDYSKSQIEKLEQEHQAQTQEMESRNKEAQELHEKHEAIDKEVRRLNDEKKALETRRETTR